MYCTAQEIYIQVISVLSPSDRLRLVALIINNLVQYNTNIVNQSDTWTEQDQLDLAIFSTQSDNL
ncbi:MAG: hypothetical protein MUE44_08320 [Oscillatoriaceae cyanobacterium Prado104]|nr:hypothetical protein [Oscillatoriaceae cyanobacterium Prado104]